MVVYTHYILERHVVLCEKSDRTKIIYINSKLLGQSNMGYKTITQSQGPINPKKLKAKRDLVVLIFASLLDSAFILPGRSLGLDRRY